MVDLDRLHTRWRARRRGLKALRPHEHQDAEASFSLAPSLSTSPEASRDYAGRIRALAREVPLGNLAAQSVIVAALKILEHSLRQERQVAQAAISMAQQTRLCQMTRELQDAIAALRALLTEQGAAMLQLPASPETPSDATDSWWFALTGAIQELEKGARRLASMASGQPRGGPVRRLSGIVARLLHSHHNQLLREAEQWMT